MTPSPSELDAPLSTDDQAVLRVFRQFLMTAGQMLCFYGNDLDRYKAALKRLTEQRLIQAERFPGGYSLTPSGYQAMRNL